MCWHDPESFNKKTKISEGIEKTRVNILGRGGSTSSNSPHEYGNEYTNICYTVLVLKLGAHWNNLGSFKKFIMSVFHPTDSDLLV